MPLEIDSESPFLVGRSLNSITKLTGEEKSSPEVRMLIEHTAKTDPGFAATVVLGGIFADMLTAAIAKIDAAITGMEKVSDDQSKCSEDHRRKLNAAASGHVLAVNKAVVVADKMFEDFRKDRAELAVKMHAMRRELDIEKRVVKIAAGTIVTAVLLGLLIFVVLNHSAA